MRMAMALDAMHGAEKQRARVAGQRATKAGGGVRRRSCRRCGLRRLVIRKEVLAAASIGSIRVPAPKTPHQRKIGGAASVLALLAVVSRRISGREEGGGGGGRRAGFLRRADARHRVSRSDAIGNGARAVLETARLGLRLESNWRRRRSAHTRMHFFQRYSWRAKSQARHDLVLRPRARVKYCMFNSLNRLRLRLYYHGLYRLRNVTKKTVCR